MTPFDGKVMKFGHAADAAVRLTASARAHSQSFDWTVGCWNRTNEVPLIEACVDRSCPVEGRSLVDGREANTTEANGLNDTSRERETFDGTIRIRVYVQSIDSDCCLHARNRREIRASEGEH